MIKIIIVTHGNLCRAFLETAEMIIGHLEDISTYEIWPQTDLEALKHTLYKEVADADKAGRPVQILTDIFYGTPFNIVISLMEDLKFEHVSGLNLSMLVEILCAREDPTFKICADDLVRKGRDSIMNCNRVLEEKKQKKGGEEK